MATRKLPVWLYPSWSALVVPVALLAASSAAAQDAAQAAPPAASAPVSSPAASPETPTLGGRPCTYEVCALRTPWRSANLLDFWRVVERGTPPTRVGDLEPWLVRSAVSEVASARIEADRAVGARRWTWLGVGATMAGLVGLYYTQRHSSSGAGLLAQPGFWGGVAAGGLGFSFSMSLYERQRMLEAVRQYNAALPAPQPSQP
jgi:hypothetical protein